MNFLEYTYENDAAVENRLRIATGNKIDNETLITVPPERDKLQRGIDHYSDLVGSLIRLAILFFAIIIWVIFGLVPSSDSNWWLLIGTHALLIVLHKNKVGAYEKAQFVPLIDGDRDMLASINVTQLGEERAADNSLNCRILVAVGNVCSHMR